MAPGGDLITCFLPLRRRRLLWLFAARKALAEAAVAAQGWAAMNRKRAAQPEAVKAGREAESLRSEYGAT